MTSKVMTEKEKAQTIKNRILRIIESQKMDGVRVKRVGDRVLFWREPETEEK